MATTGISIVSYGLLTELSFRDFKLVAKLFELWHETAPDYFPDKYDVNEPIRRTFSLGALADLEHVWDLMVFFKKSKVPRVEADFSIPHANHEAADLSSFSISAAQSNIDLPLAKFIEQASVFTDAQLAYIHRASNADVKFAYENKTGTILKESAIDKSPVVSVFSKHLALGLPNLYWCTVLGKKYVELIGRDKIAECPVHRVEWLSSDIAMLVLTESVNDSVDSEMAFEELRETVKTYLGRSIFQPLSWPVGYRPIVDILNQLAKKNTDIK